MRESSPRVRAQHQRDETGVEVDTQELLGPAKDPSQEPLRDLRRDGGGQLSLDRRESGRCPVPQVHQLPQEDRVQRPGERQVRALEALHRPRVAGGGEQEAQHISRAGQEDRSVDERLGVGGQGGGF